MNGAEETVFADGTIQNLDINGDKTISFPNGQREIHTQNYKVSFFKSFLVLNLSYLPNEVVQFQVLWPFNILLNSSALYFQTCELNVLSF